MSDKPFEGVLGNNVHLRLLEHLMSTPRMDFNITELERITGVSRPSVDQAVKEFNRWGIVREISKRGNMKFYAIDDENNLVKSMRDFNTGLMEIMFPDLFDGPLAPFAPPRVIIEDAPVPNASSMDPIDGFTWCVPGKSMRENQLTASAEPLEPCPSST